MRKLQRLIFFILLFFLFQNSYPQALPKIAVLDFKAYGISNNESAAFSDRLRSELVRTNSYIVLDKERVDNKLQDASSKLSACTDTECAIEIGKILKIEKIVSGKIRKMQTNSYMIDILYIDIESGQIERAFNRDYRGNIDGLNPILREIAFEMIPTRKGISKIPLYSSGIIALSSAAVSGFSIYKAQGSYKKFQDATIGEDAIKYKDDTEFYDNLSLITGITAGVTTIIYFIYDHYYDRSLKPKGFSATPFIQKGQAYGFAINIIF